MARQRRKGQALVEFALIVPILLLMLVGMIGVGLLLVDRLQLQHAANEAAVAGAQQNGDCASALGRVHQVLGRSPADKQCHRTGQLVEVTVTDHFGFSFDVLPSSITVTGRAVVREEPLSSASATPETP